MNMKIMTAVDAEIQFEELLDSAQQEPVLITRKNRPVSVFFSIQDIEDTAWGKDALEAHSEGYLSAKESVRLLNEL